MDKNLLFLKNRVYFLFSTFDEATFCWKGSLRIISEGWQSGWMYRPGKAAYGYSVSRVRIPLLPPVYPLAFFSLFLTYPRKPHIFDSFKPIVRYHFLYHFPTFPRFSPLSPVSVGVSVGVSGIGFARNENHLAKIYSYVARWQTLDRP